MYTTDKDLAYARHLRSEHQRLQEAIRFIDRQWPCEPDPIVPSPQVVERLKELCDDLVRHFASEEEGGLLEEAACRCPSLGSEVDRIQNEHPWLLAGLNSIIERLESGFCAERVVGLREQFTQFARDLQSHEASENDVLERAFGIGEE